MKQTTLAHYGVLGMKWGVRKGRSSTSADDAVKNERKQTSQVRRHLSDGDLKKAIDRLQQEKKLKDLTEQDIAPGKTAAKSVLSTIGKSTLTAVGTATATYAIKAAMEGKFDVKEAAKFIRPKK